MLEGTEKNFERLKTITTELLELAGESPTDPAQPNRKEDLASLRILLDHAKARKSDVDDTVAHMEEILDTVIAQHEETGAISDPDVVRKAAAFMKAGTALSLAEDEWIEFLQKAIKAPSVDPFRVEIGRKGEWLEERWKVYEEAKAELQALVGDTDGGSA
jgi:hypothetical protein